MAALSSCSPKTYFSKCSRGTRKAVKAEYLCPEIYKNLRDTIRQIKFTSKTDTLIIQKDSLVYVTEKGDTVTVKQDTIYRDRWHVTESPSPDTVISVFNRLPSDIKRISDLELDNTKLKGTISQMKIKGAIRSRNVWIIVVVASILWAVFGFMAGRSGGL